MGASTAWLNLQFSAGGGVEEYESLMLMSPRKMNDGTAALPSVDVATLTGFKQVVLAHRNSVVASMSSTVVVSESDDEFGTFVPVLTLGPITGRDAFDYSQVEFTQPWAQAELTISGADAVGGAWLSVTLSGVITGGGLPPMQAGLFVRIDDKGPYTVLGDVTRPTGSLSTLQAVGDWSSTIYLPDGSKALNGPLLNWTPTTLADIGVVMGWFLATTDGPPVLLLWDYFPSPIALPIVASMVSFRPAIVAPAYAGWTRTKTIVS